MIYIAYLLFIGFGYTSEDMNSNHKNVVVDMISRSFAEKGDLTTLAKVTYDDLYEQVRMINFYIKSYLVAGSNIL